MYQLRGYNIWWEELQVLAQDRQEMLNLMAAVAGAEGTLEISLPCGSRKFQSENDIPFEDLVCECGEHYYIKYKGDGNGKENYKEKKGTNHHTDTISRGY